MSKRSLALVVVPVALLAGGACGACSSEEDRAAKAHIFSPEDPPRVLQAAAEELDASALAGNPELVRRVLSISAQEAAARLGTHVQTSKVHFRWAAADRTVVLDEDRLVVLGHGGDFHVKSENTEHQGMEWFRIGGASYARSRYAPFRERRRDRGSSEHVVASAYSALETFHEIIRGAVELRQDGTAPVAGRTAIRYTLATGDVRKDPDAERLPKLQLPKGGPDADTKLRLEAVEKGVPQEVGGTLLVDQLTAVPLSAEIRAALVVPGESGQSRLDLTVTLQLSDIGKDPKLAPPEHLEDEPRPPGVVAVLDAYGMPRATGDGDGGTSDGGTAGVADEPDDPE